MILMECEQCTARTLNKFVIETENGQLIHCICNACYAEWVE